MSGYLPWMISSAIDMTKGIRQKSASFVVGYIFDNQIYDKSDTEALMVLPNTDAGNCFT